MFYLYYLMSLETPKYYIGITNNIKRRFASHKSAAKSNKKSPLYDSMRKYSFYIVQVEEYKSLIEVQEAEVFFIREARQCGRKILNLADGGEGGYVIPETSKEAWKTKLSKARQGAKPSLGMKHSEENKRFFSECNKRRKLLYPNLDVNKCGFKEAKNLYGISKTHYYRLLKRVKINDLN